MSVNKKILNPVDWTQFGPGMVVGVDEAGRGCLAGPVVAAAVVLRHTDGQEAFRDSKKLTAGRRDKLYAQICREHMWSVGFATVEEIDRINILQAALLAMRRAVEGLILTEPFHVLVDGIFTIPKLGGCLQTAFIQGDDRLHNIAAASIVAKVTRDRCMVKLAEEFPEYGFEVHKGYGTEKHRQALDQMGASPAHRRSFRGVPL